VPLFEPIFDALNRAGVRYVVVGGVAVVLHGVARLTADLDLAVDLTPPEARKAIDALVACGFRSRLPVDPRQFADPAVRATWAREKAMRVFPLWDPTNPLCLIDLFVENPVRFDELWEHSVMLDVGSTAVRVASIPDLIRLKRMAARPQDLIDIADLETILKERGDV
jgi:hypothetical protein